MARQASGKHPPIPRTNRFVVDVYWFVQATYNTPQWCPAGATTAWSDTDGVPTRFSINLTCTVTDLSGKVVFKKVVSGQGNAEFSEFKSNFALSAQRASENMLSNLQKALSEAPEFSATLPSAAAVATAR
ncbi:hypothetical protein ACTMU2_41840 [Cupriavidus basilensis]